VIRVLLERVRAEPGIAGLYLFAATMHANRALAVLACLLLFQGLWRERSRVWRALAGFPPGPWLAGLAALAVLRSLLAAMEAPEAAVEHLKAGARFVYFLGMLPVAWFLAGDQRRLLRVFAVALGGFLLARLAHLALSLQFPFQAWLRERPGLGLEPIALGYYAGCALLGVLILLPGCHEAAAPRRKPWLLLGALPVLMSLSLFTIWSQSRGAWLSLLPCLAVALGWLLAKGGGQARSVVLVLLITGLAAAYHGREVILERLSAEPETLSLLLRGDLGAVRSAGPGGRELSIGTRITMLRAGLEAAAERPWIGHGPAAPELMLAAHPDRILRRWNDFHSAPVDLLVRFGVCGLVVCGGLLISIVAGGLHPVFRAAYERDVRLVLWLGIALLVLSSVTNFRLLNFDWRYWLFLFAGAMVSPALRCPEAVRSS